MSDEKQEQIIKGIIAHELCHYGLMLIYQNKENPYYNGDDETAKIFDEIVVKINKWTLDEFEESDEDDECEGTISFVYTLYDEEEYHPELIVRPIHIQAQFDNDVEKLKVIERKYDQLFDFVRRYVLPEMEKFNLKDRESVVKLNKQIGLISDIENENINVKCDEDLKNIFEHQNAVLISNSPKLLLINIYKYLWKSEKTLVNSKNLFFTSKKFNKDAFFEEFKEIMKTNSSIKVFIDCTAAPVHNFPQLTSIEAGGYYLVSSCAANVEEVNSIFNSNVLNREINYLWNNLTLDSQMNILESIVTFQTSTEHSLSSILTFKNRPESTSLMNELSNIIDNQLLNLLITNSNISINTNFFNELSCDKKFNLLFLPRKFIKVKKGSAKECRSELSQKELFNDVKNSKFVLISDIAGTGKTWALKDIARNICSAYPTHWVSFICSRLYTNVFKDFSSDFVGFVTEHVMRTQSSFEKEIFKKMYENGKVIALFNGFDEICPNYHDQVIKLFQNFKYNSGNQLWIVTRDLFENELQEKFDIKCIYKLDKFTEKHGIELIAASWILNDLQQDKVFTKDCIKNSKNFRKFQNAAQNLVKKMSNVERKFIGFPQFYIMVEFVFKDDKNPENKFNLLKIYFEFVNISINTWQEKGELRKNKSTKAHQSSTGYIEIHQYFAMKSIFTDRDEFCGIEYDEDEWTVQDIVGCGMINIINESFLFTHETFREYFVASFIITTLKKGGKSDFYIFFIKILTLKKFEIVRIFLNEALAEESEKKKIFAKIQKLKKNLLKNIDELDDLTEIIRENLYNLFCFLLELFNHSEYEKVKKILDKNIIQIIKATQNIELFKKFNKFFMNFLNLKDLKIFTKSLDLLKTLAKSNLESEILIDFFENLEKKCGTEFIKTLLELRDNDNKSFVIFLCLLQYHNDGLQKIFVKILQNYFTRCELLKLLQETDKQNRNILHIVIEEENVNFQVLWSKIHILFTFKNSLHKFKEFLLSKCSSFGYNVFHLAALNSNLEFHKHLWKLLRLTYDNGEELKNAFLEKDNNGNNFLYHIIINGKFKIIELTFEMMKKELSENLYDEILNSKSANERNLLHVALSGNKNIQTHKTLWKVLYDSCKSQEKFIKMLSEADAENNNILNISASHSTRKVLEFMIEKLEKFMSKNKIKEMLRNENYNKDNILHLSFSRNCSFGIHAILWEILHKYLTHLEILEVMRRKNNKMKSALMILASQNNFEVINFVWTEIKGCLKTNESTAVEIIKECDDFFENQINLFGVDQSADKYDERNTIELKLKKIEKVIELNIVVNIVQNASVLHNSNEIFDILSYQDEIEQYKSEWDKLFASNENLENLKNSIIQNNFSDKNFIHLLITNSRQEIIEVTFNIFKERFNEACYCQVVHNKDKRQRNILQVFVSSSNDFELFKILWNILKTSFGNFEEFVDFLEEPDISKQNIFYSVIVSTRNKVFEFLIDELENAKMEHKIKNFLKSCRYRSENLLQKASSNLLETCQKIWENMERFLNNDEIFEVISHKDKFDKNILLHVVGLSSLDIVEFTFIKIRTFVSDLNLIELLKSKDSLSQNVLHYCAARGHKEILEFVWKNVKECFENSHDQFKELVKEKSLCENSNVLHLAAKNVNIEFHESFINLLIKTFENRDELISLIIVENSNHDNFLKLIIITKELKIVELLVKHFKEIFSEIQLKYILDSKNHYGRNLLIQTCKTSSLEICHLIWKIHYNSCESPAKFIDKIAENDNCGGNILNIVANFSSSDIFEFLITELEKLTTKFKIKKLLNNLNSQKREPLRDAIHGNQSLNMHKTIWKVYRKYFHPSEILNKVQAKDLHEFNMMCIAVAGSSKTKEIIEFTYKQILISIDENEVLDIDRLEKEILNCEDFEGKNLLQIAGCFLTDPEAHKFLWEVFRNTFDNFELLEIIQHRDHNGNCLFHNILSLNSKLIETIYVEILKSFNSDKNILKEIFTVKDRYGKNLLHRAVECNNVQIYKFLWNNFKNSFESENEFLKFFMTKDYHQRNIFHHLISFATVEILDFAIEEFEKITPLEKIKFSLCSQDINTGNIIFAAKNNKFTETYERLWIHLRKFFNKVEIFKLITHENEYEENIILNSFSESSKEFLMVTWNEIKISLCSNEDSIVNELEETLKNINDKDAIRAKWKEFENHLKTQFVGEVTFPENLTDFQVFTFIHGIEIHRKLWNKLLENREQLKSFIMERDTFGDNFVHNLIANNNSDIIDFTFQILKDNFTNYECRKILNVKGNSGRNLLQTAVRYSKPISIFESLWTGLQAFYKSNDELVSIITSVDKNKRHVFHYVALFSSEKIFNFLMLNFEKISSTDDFRNILKALDIQEYNLLQYAAQYNQQLKLHESIWSILLKRLNIAKVLDIIKHVDRDGNSLFFNSVKGNTKEIVEFTWDKIKLTMERRELIEYLQKKGQGNKDLREMSSDHNRNRDVHLWIQNLLHEYGL